MQRRKATGVSLSVYIGMEILLAAGPTFATQMLGNLKRLRMSVSVPHAIRALFKPC